MAEKQFLTDEELDRNYDAFKAALPELIKTDAGKFVIVREGKLGDVYPTRLDAHRAGWREFNDDLFSVQEITDEPVYLGIYSHVLDFGPA